MWVESESEMGGEESTGCVDVHEDSRSLDLGMG